MNRPGENRGRTPARRARAGFFGTWLVALSMILFAWSSAAAAGRFEGTITDVKTGEPLSGVNIVVKGTHLGAATDLDGYYIIPGVHPGSYDLQASFIGYKIAIKTDIRLKGDETVRVDFALEPTVLAIGQEVIFIGRKPLLDVEQTSTTRVMSSEDISDLVVESVDDILSQQIGVTSENNEIHIRGGRADENMYIIDNLSVKDPISGKGLGIYLSADAIKQLEVITGGFNAEYGEAMSGLVNVETREGGDDYSGSMSYKSDNIGGWPAGNQNTGSGEFSFGGPEPLTKFLLPGLGVKIPGKMSFFINGYGYASDTYLPHSPERLAPYRADYDPLALREENNWSILAKVTYKPSDIYKLSYSYGRSVRINQGFFDSLLEDKTFFPLEYRYILQNYNTFTRDGIQQTFNWSHSISRRTFYEITFGNFYNRVNSDVKRKGFRDYVQPVDLAPIFYDPLYNGEILVSYGDGYWDDGDGDVYHDHYTDTYQFKAHLTSQVNQANLIKTGIEYEQTKLQSFTIHDPWITTTEFGGDYDLYHAVSEAGVVFFQDKIEFMGMIANLGYRFDWWRPGEYVENVIDDPNTVYISDRAREIFHETGFWRPTPLSLYFKQNIFNRSIKGLLSPRIGISHPISDADVMFVSYGMFSQRPKYVYVFSKLQSYSRATYQLIGNPNLDPQITVAAEMGMKHRFTGDQVVELVAFYKDLYGYPTSTQVKDENPRLGTTTYYQYFNMDYARARGVEFRFRARQGRYLNGTAEFAYQIVTGKSSSSNAAIQAAANTQVIEKTLGERYLRWDKPISASLTLFLRVPRGDHPRWFGLKWPDQWGGSIRFDLQSGKRYTPARLVNNGQDIQDTGDEYSAISEMWNTVDTKFWKEWQVLGDVSFRVFLEVENLFNFKRPNSINSLTGRPYEEGDPHPLTWENPQGFVLVDPSRWKAPRQVFFGAGLRF